MNLYEFLKHLDDLGHFEYKWSDVDGYFICDIDIDIEGRQEIFNWAVENDYSEPESADQAVKDIKDSDHFEDFLGFISEREK